MSRNRIYVLELISKLPKSKIEPSIKHDYYMRYIFKYDKNGHSKAFTTTRSGSFSLEFGQFLESIGHATVKKVRTEYNVPRGIRSPEDVHEWSIQLTEKGLKFMRWFMIYNFKLKGKDKLMSDFEQYKFLKNALLITEKENE